MATYYRQTIVAQIRQYAKVEVSRRLEILEKKVISIGGEMKYIVVILASLVVGMLLALIVSGG